MANAANRKDIRAAEKRIVRARIVEREVICGLMQVANGREWIWNRLEEAGIFTSAFSPEPAIHAYNAGLRVVATKLFSDVMLYAPEQFTLMMREAHERSAASEFTGSQNGDGRDQGRLYDASDRDLNEDYNPYGDPEPGTED